MRTLHLVSFDVPYPPDYGGIVAVLDLIKLLRQKGIKIILHVFVYNNKTIHSDLEDLCLKIYTYPRSTGFLQNFSTLPYIVKSRKHPELLTNLSKDSYPVLFEGVHTCYCLAELYKMKQNIFVRAHNVEWRYYHYLSKHESSIWRKLYFLVESYKLKKFEQNIFQFCRMIFCFTENDAKFFKAIYSNVWVYNPAFALLKSESQVGQGTGVLFHGNLSVNDASESVKLIVLALANTPEIKITIAGKNPNKELIDFLKKFDQVTLIINPSDLELLKLIRNAHVNVCYTMNSEGFKMRLLPLLQFGKFILCNDNFCTDDGLAPTLCIENDLQKWPNIIQLLLKKEYSETDLKIRQQIISKFNHHNNPDSMIMTIFKLD